jgi:hypothetical protein
MPNHEKRNYQVGYGRPPEYSRFRKGESGNPLGRPKGSKNLATLLNDALNEPLVVTENGKRKRITKRKAVLKQLVNKAASGNARAIQLLLGEMRLVELHMTEETVVEDREQQLRLLRAMTPEERQASRAFQRQLEQRVKSQETTVEVNAR